MHDRLHFVNDNRVDLRRPFGPDALIYKYETSEC